MTIPTLGWNDDASPGGAGSFESWSGVDKDAEDMIEQLIDVMLPFFNSLVTFDNAVIFTKATPTSVSFPVASASWVGKDGTNPSATWWQAVQTTVIARTTVFSLAKLVMLDSVAGDNFDPEYIQSAAMLALTAEWFDLANGWSGRVDGRPKTFVKSTQTLNEKLRRAYHLD